MLSIKDLQEQLLTHAAPLPANAPEERLMVVVLKQYKFHKQLSIELYTAETTVAGKLKNPLLPVAPLDAAMTADTPTAIKFFTAVSRFQNNPTAAKSAADITALKIIMANPFGLRFFYHDPLFSENVVAGSLQEVAIGAVINDVTLIVNRKQDFYELLPQIKVQEQLIRFDDVILKYDFFLLIKNIIYLIGSQRLLKVIRFFKQNEARLSVHESKYEALYKEVLSKLEDQISIEYNDKEKLSPSEPEQAPTESIIYLSESGPYVIIEPVMRYGNTEIPVRSKRQLHTTDAGGKAVILPRNNAAETAFMAKVLRQHPYFEEQLEEDIPYFYLHRKHFLAEDWFLAVFEQWQAEDITILGFNELKGNKTNGHKARIHVTVSSGLNWFNADVDVRFGKKKASLKALAQAVRSKSGYVLLDDGTQGIVPDDWLQRFEAYFAAGEIVDEELHIPKMAFPSAKELFDAAQIDDTVQKELLLFQTKLNHPEGIAPVPQPKELAATLRSYQQQGLAWLNFLDDHNFGGVLADDMGLGKTAQILAFILLQRRKSAHNTNLVVVPASLLFNWQAEVQKFAPDISLLTLYGAGRIKNLKELSRYEVVLTSYGTLVADAALLRSYTFNYIFLDEAQNIKNISSQRYAAVRLLQSRNKIAITGTPVENSTFDLYAQVSFACPGLLGNRRSFRDLFSIPIDKFKSSRHLKDLQQKVAPFILRRTKAQVASELPQKTEITLYCPMGEAQRKVYDAHEKAFRDFMAGKDESELSKNTLHILKELTRLRQICNAPQLLPDGKLYEGEAAKIDILMEQLQNVAATHKVLVFSQFVSMLHLIEAELVKRGLGYALFTGATKDREGVVNTFQNNDAVRVLLLSLKAGGTGLNLTAADYVYLVDPWWNPAVEQQAIDRTHRIGQTNPVVAVRLICPGTLEEKMMQLQQTKSALFENLIKSDALLLQSISKEEWMHLLNQPEE